MAPRQLATMTQAPTVANGWASRSFCGPNIIVPSDVPPGIIETGWLQTAHLLIPLYDSEPGAAVQLNGWPGQFFRQRPVGAASAPLPAEPLFGFWLPRPLAPLQWHCLAASRLGQRLAGDRQLISAVQQVVDSLPPDAAMYYSPRFALAAHLRAVSIRTGLRLFELKQIPATATRSWFRQQTNRLEREPRSKLYFFRLPTLTPAAPTRSVLQSTQPAQRSIEARTAEPSKTPNFSAVDWLAIHLAQRVHVLSVRAGGQIEQAVQSRLRLQDSLTLDVRLLDAPHLTDPVLAASLYQSGAVLWRGNSAERMQNKGTLAIRPARPKSTQAAKITAPPRFIVRESFLFHWTRTLPLNRRRESDPALVKLLQRPANFGDQDKPVASAPTSIDGPLRTLFEIVSSTRILASGRWTADRSPVVSLTAQPLERWPELRRYRPHLGRWDFEFFGVALSRGRVLELGGRSVIYGDHQTRRKLAPADLPWFQQSWTRQAGSAIDWTVEQEWRVRGDIDLRQFGPEEAYLFVSNQEAADRISPFSRWPVIAFFL